MNPQPLVSLILATVGRVTEVGRLFESLTKQTFRDFEVLVVDQNTDDRLLPNVEDARKRGLDVRHIRHSPPNLATARNAGIQAAKGIFIGFPDDDCWYDDRALERIASYMRQSERPDGIVLRWVEQDEQPLQTAMLSWERARTFRDVSVSSITLFCERTLFQTIGGFDARLGVGQWFGAGEETDFVLRALRANMAFLYEPTAEVHHAVDSRRPIADRKTRLAVRNRARGTGALYAKHRLPTWVVLRGLAAPILRPLLKASFGAELALGYATVVGRLGGMLRWYFMHS